MTQLSKHADAPATLEHRVRYYARVFARGIGRSPTSPVRLAIARAARLTAIAEAAALNPETSANDVVRLDGCAAKSRRDMEAALRSTKPAKQLTADSLKNYARQKYAVTA
jgi:hypothetical protein